MTPWEVQELVEMDRNHEWEEINAPDPAEKEMISSAEQIREALGSLDIACYRLMDAQSEVQGYPMEYRVGSFYDDLISLSNGLKELAEKFERGERG